MRDKYVYPGSDVLINKLDIRNEVELNYAERIFTATRLLELEQNPIKGMLNLKHLQDIHKYIFQDIYPFAGKIREVNISKGMTEFANVIHIQSAANEIFENLKKENHLKGMDKETFAERAAKYFGDINHLHPFREGNGRSERELFRTIAGQAGYKLDWNRVDPKMLFTHSVLSMVNEKPLSKTVAQCIVNDQPDKEISRLFNFLLSRGGENFLER